MASKILIVGPAWVGDMVMAQSLFKLLKQQEPEARIHVLAPAWTFSLLSCMPEVERAIELPCAHRELKLSVRYQLAKKLRTENYTQAIVLPNSFKAAIIPWLAKIPVRTGWLGEFRHIVLNDIRHLDKKIYPLMIEQFMALGLHKDVAIPRPYPYPEFRVSADSQKETLIKHKPIWRGRPVLAICAGAEFGPSKRWVPEYFAEVANQMITQGWDIWLFGSAKDRPITESIMTMTQNQCENISGRTELSETINLISLVSGVVTNDSGLMHVAAALNKPIVAIYGSTSPDFTPPLGNKARIFKLNLPCQPCFKRVCPLKHHRCMRDITPDHVLAAISQWNSEYACTTH